MKRANVGARKAMTDKELLDGLQSSSTGYGNGWVLRKSGHGRGMRLHESSGGSLCHDVRKAIERYLQGGCDEG